VGFEGVITDYEGNPDEALTPHKGAAAGRRCFSCFFGLIAQVGRGR